MEDELEEMWKKLSFTEEEGESISLGSSTTVAAKLVGRNCFVMKVLSHKCMNIETLRKNLRMLWKPNKGVQINEIGDELFLVEFGDGRDKKRVMDMSPWTYEKQLILLKEFVGEQVPKEISLWQSPFLVQIHNLPLNSRTRETGWAIGSKLGEVMEVDVAESGVQWGRYLRVRVKMDVTKKLVWGKKIAIEGREQRWIAFKYECLPNFCYRCGLLNHGLRDCPDGKMEDMSESSPLQYRAWLRGEVPRRGGDESFKFELEDRWQTRRGLAKGMVGGRGRSSHAPEMSLENGKISESTLPHMGESDRGEESIEGDLESRKQRNDHEKGKETNLREYSQGINTKLVKENGQGLWAQNQEVEGMLWEKETHPEVEVPFKFRGAPNTEGGGVEVGQDSVDKKIGPMAMSFDTELGWVAEELGPRSSHWKRLARKAHRVSPTEEVMKDKTLGKRPGPIPIQDLETNVTTRKRSKTQEQSKVFGDSEEKDGGEVKAAEQPR